MQEILRAEIEINVLDDGAAVLVLLFARPEKKKTKRAASLGRRGPEKRAKGTRREVRRPSPSRFATTWRICLSRSVNLLPPIEICKIFEETKTKSEKKKTEKEKCARWKGGGERGRGNGIEGMYERCPKISTCSGEPNSRGIDFMAMLCKWRFAPITSLIWDLVNRRLILEPN
ncbi:hypothetical protein Trydic_g20043 [Trypoxylus dichotomus]